MSTPTDPFTLHLPEHWTPEQALAVYELLQQLADSVWNRYAPVLHEQLRDPGPLDSPQLDLFDLDDELPF
jgi:hypothetical protein